MGAFAFVTMQVDLTRRDDAAVVAQDLIDTFPGTRNTHLDAATGSVSFEIIFPGNLSALVARLRSARVPAGDRAKVVLPVRSLVPELLDDKAHVERTLSDGPEIWDVAFERGAYVQEASLEGDRVSATIVTSSNSMHQLYDALLKLGLVVHGEAQPSRVV